MYRADERQAAFLKVQNWPTQLVLMAALALTMPNVLFLLLCAGLLPLFGQMFFLGGFDVFTLAVATNILVALVLIFFIARVITNRLESRFVYLLVVPAVLAMGLLRLYGFDCMDGGSYVNCNAYEVYRDLMKEASAWSGAPVDTHCF